MEATDYNDLEEIPEAVASATAAAARNAAHLAGILNQRTTHPTNNVGIKAFSRAEFWITPTKDPIDHQRTTRQVYP
jgi:hypothetical protein